MGNGASCTFWGEKRDEEEWNEQRKTDLFKRQCNHLWQVHFVRRKNEMNQDMRDDNCKTLADATIYKCNRVNLWMWTGRKLLPVEMAGTYNTKETIFVSTPQPWWHPHNQTARSRWTRQHQGARGDWDGCDGKDRLYNWIVWLGGARNADGEILCNCLPFMSLWCAICSIHLARPTQAISRGFIQKNIAKTWGILQSYSHQIVKIVYMIWL